MMTLQEIDSITAEARELIWSVIQWRRDNDGVFGYTTDMVIILHHYNGIQRMEQK